MRILIAGLLGAIAMFLWTFVAHMVTPLGSTGFSHMQGEAAVLDTMDKSIGDHPGLYFFPWVDQNDPKMMEKSAALEKIHPSGLLLYRPAGKGMEGMPPSMLITEFVKQFVEATIAAWIVSMSTVARIVPCGIPSSAWAKRNTSFHRRASRKCSSLAR